ARPFECSLARTRIVVSRTISLVRAVTGANASHGLGEDLFGFLGGAGSTAVIHLGEVVPQLLDEFFPALLGESRGLDGTNADLLVFQYTASEQTFNGRLLV